MPLLHVTDSDAFLMYYHVFTIMSNTMNPFTCETLQVSQSVVV